MAIFWANIGFALLISTIIFVFILDKIRRAKLTKGERKAEDEEDRREASIW